jgi:predicted ATPase
MIHKIVITGAPASGKTIFIDRLKNDIRFADFIFFSEIARKLLAENPSYRNDWSLFHRDIYKQQVERENRYLNTSFISDRGTVDAFAFHPETMNNVGTDINKEYIRYNNIIHLESTAVLGDKYYNTDDIRNETINDAIIIEEKLKNVWSNHPGYIFINAQPSIEKKYKNFLIHLLDIIKM